MVTVLPKSQFISANGLRFHYLDWGNPKAPPLLMLHGAGLCAHTWEPIAQGLAPDFHVMAFDQRGHGDTDGTPGDYLFERLGEDLAAIIQEAGWPALRVVGHSAGGLATIIAASLLPGRIQRAVLVDTRVGPRPAAAPGADLRQRAERARMKRTVWDSRQAMSEAYRTRAAFKSWREDVFQSFIDGGTRLQDDGRAALKCLPEVEAAFYENRDSVDISKYLPGLQGRFLLLLGRYPGAQTLEDAGVQRFLKQVPGATVKPMPKGTHFMPMEYPDMVLEEARRFLRD
ncbi:MAG: alpha/beta hydrolase [Dehalococcoidia bacterium]|nr:alpha/beta hydrolase [Dehalococcoidia bacterium]MSQ17595.1 alpha/beta hydrolase [Dehalococcoidia bacterium]